MAQFISIFSTYFLQVSNAEALPIEARPDPGMLSSSPFGLDFLFHGVAIWGALIAIAIIVILIRKRGRGAKRGYQDTYHKELEAMRKGRRD